MSFSQSSREISLGPKNRLLAKCRKLDGTETDSSFNLDSCLGNKDGYFATDGKRFSASAREIRLKGVILSAQLERKNNGGWHRDAINLDAFLGNADGNLTLYVHPTAPNP